ncbi:MAG: recombination mediator RecR [Peptococcaceae bacterium]|nr:recombination mediator RecR [Peptococcaceae bacterium]
MDFFVYPKPLAEMIAGLAKLPGIGPKTAGRLAFFLLQNPETAQSLSRAIETGIRDIRQCTICCNYSEADTCAICRSEQRDRTLICVVEQPRDVASLEKTREFKGYYHVLHGVLSPMDGIGPDELKIKELLTRMSGVQEVVLALNPTVEGEATALYVARLLKPLGITVTRIAHGLPVGGDLEYADEVTIARALEGRRAL